MSRASNRRQSSESDEGGGANWMDTYGDLVTLLLCFFVFLFSFSSVDAQKWEALVGAFTGTGVSAITVMDAQEAIQRPIELLPSTADEQESKTNEDEDKKKDLENFWILVESLKAYITDNSFAAEIIEDVDTVTITVRFGDNIFFDSGRAEIKEESMPILDGLTALLIENLDYIDMISIEGHTDNVPISNEFFSDNWDLSTKRATNTLRYMSSMGLTDKTKLTAGGYAEFQPVQSNDTEAGRAANRRVDFVVESKTGNPSI